MPDSRANGPNIRSVDVSELEPPEPMEQILDQLRELHAGQLLRVRHRREPFPLYPILDDLGYEHRCVSIQTEVFLIYIWPRADRVDEAFIQDDAAGQTQ